jgi:hypothetical protein
MDQEEIQTLNELIDKSVSVAYIKLIKNTKGYNWEIKQLSLDIQQLEKLNNELLTKFGDVK